MSKSHHISPNQPKENGHKKDCLPVQFMPHGETWYLVHCKSNSEKIAIRNLENQGFSAFLPLQEVTLRRGTIFQTQLKPLFPGYIFVAQNQFSGQWRKINNTRGVARLVCLGADPTAVPPSIMHQLFVCCDGRNVFQQSASLVVGNDVKIIQGSLTGIIATITEITPDQRIHLLVNFMGQTSKLELDTTGVEPIN